MPRSHLIKSAQYDPIPAGRHLCVLADTEHQQDVQTKFGIKTLCRFIFQSQEVNPATGERYQVRTQRFTESLHPRSALAQFLTQWRRQPITQEEQNRGFDIGRLIGLPVYLTTSVHTAPETGRPFARIEFVEAAPANLAFPAVGITPADTVDVAGEAAAAAATAAAPATSAAPTGSTVPGAAPGTYPAPAPAAAPGPEAAASAPAPLDEVPF